MADSSPNSIQGKRLINAQYPSVLIGSAVTGAKSHGDTVYVYGDPDSDGDTYGTGQFQLDAAPSVPDPEGWTGIDLTAKTESKWHIDTFNAANLVAEGNHAIWAGEVFPPCNEEDTILEGYNNNYNELLERSYAVSSTGADTDLTISLLLNYDSEPGYDFLYLLYETTGGWQEVHHWTGTNAVAGEFPTAPSYSYNVHYDMNTYVDGKVHLRFAAISDGAWSDADCLYLTSGLAQMDNIHIEGNNGTPTETEYFETGLVGSNWETALPQGVGQFAQVWPYLGALDPCVANDSPQFAFIDDGLVETCGGVGGLGTLGAAGHQYAVLDGWAVNLLGGCAGESEHLNNEIWSPEIDWPVGDFVGAHFKFSVYRDLPVSNGMFYVWHVKSAYATNVWSSWQDRNFVYYGSSKDYLPVDEDVTDLIVQSPTKLQLALGAYELGWVFGLEGTDATPGPYFDNVAFLVYPSEGPQITTRELELAQDNFPTSGSITYGQDLSIAFDMANDIRGGQGPEIDVGDSITFNITAVRAGSELDPSNPPLMYWTMKQNPAFGVSDRTSSYGMATSGTAPANDVIVNGNTVDDKYWFDLPDENFFFPGDVIHYYIWAQDLVGLDAVATTLPGNLTGYGVFDDSLNPDQYFSSSFTVHGLPTLNLETDLTDPENPVYSYSQPSMLFWNDFANRGGEEEWYFALSQLGYQRHEEYDIYYTNSPSSGVSNGLGARGTATMLGGYSTILYTSGNLTAYTICNNDPDADKSNDIDVMDAWLLSGGKNLFMTGDGILEDLDSTTEGQGFNSAWLGLTYQEKSVSDALDGQTAPVVASAHAVVMDLPRDFIAYGACPSINTFNRFTLQGGTVALANYVGGASTVPAVTYRYDGTHNSTVVFAGVDFSYWFSIGTGLSSRAENLQTILTIFGENPTKGAATGVPAAKPFFTRNYPNPFNPITKIEFSVPKAGDVSVKIYNVRGELVRTLVDEHMDASDLVVREWNGTDNHGASVASGVYFYETRTNGNVKVNKMALVK
jgi:hypothetical protein